MVDILIALGSVVSYMAIGAWTFGYSSASWAASYNLERGHDARDGSYYHDEPGAWCAAVFWPFFLPFHFVFNKMLRALASVGDKQVVKSYESRKVRIQLEERIRVEQERIEREVTEEVEATLRQRNA